jgi:hypothetical protein
MTTASSPMRPDLTAANGTDVRLRLVDRGPPCGSRETRRGLYEPARS